MYRLHQITIESLNKHKDDLINLSNIDEFKIRDIWYHSGDIYLDNFVKIEYDFDIPLYQKMIFRYRNGGNLATRLYQGLDPGNRNRLLLNYNLYYSDNNELMEFLAWIANGLGIIDIINLEGISYNDKLNSQYIPKWRQNEIKFFFDLDVIKQQLLIDRYNKDCVDQFNNRYKFDDV